MDHQKCAKVILNFLVNRIKNFNGGDKYITYGELAKAIDYPEPYIGSVFAKRIGKTLGVMGYMFNDMVIAGQQVPLIQAMVVSKSKKLPGDGIKEFNETYPSLSDEKKKDFLYAELAKIFQFGDRWNEVLRRLDIIPEETENYINGENKRYNPYGSEGSPEHRRLRDFIAINPSIINLSKELTGNIEYPLKSGDKIDVVFEEEGLIIGVEVKSRRSGNDDLERGLFQCIKYSAVLKAEEIVNKRNRVCKSILVIEGSLNSKQNRIKEMLGIDVIEGISPK